MAFFVLWMVFWVAGGTFGPVQYHPPQPAPASTTYQPVEHEGTGR